MSVVKGGVFWIRQKVLPGFIIFKSQSSRLLRYICPTDESRMTTVPKPRSWEVKLYDEKMIKPGKTFCLIQKTPAFTTDGERCAEEDQNYKKKST